jgi:hypothetical protein
MRTGRVLFVDLWTAFISPKMLLSVLGVFLFCIISVFQYAPHAPSALYLIDLLMGLSMFKKVLVILAALPFVVSFCSEWNTQYIRFLVVRDGLKRYIWSKIIVCLLSALCALFFGLMLFVVFLSFSLPVIPTDDPREIENLVRPPFTEWSAGGYLIVKVFVFSLGNAFWVVCGLALSAYIPNRFVAILSPLVFSYILEQITYHFPPWMRLYSLTRVHDVLGLGAAPSLAYFVCAFVLLTFMAGLFFSHQVKRRVRNESV